MTSSPNFRLPDRGPSADSLSDRGRFEEWTASSLRDVRASAQVWRTGLATFVALVTTSAIFKGRDITTDLSWVSRLSVTLLLCMGILLALGGLWQALAAEAGTDPQGLRLDEIRAEHGGLLAYELSLALGATRRLRLGRQLVAVALCFILLALALTWTMPSSAAKPLDGTDNGQVRVTNRSASYCGRLEALSGDDLVLTESRGGHVLHLKTADVVSLSVIARCP